MGETRYYPSYMPNDLHEKIAIMESTYSHINNTLSRIESRLDSIEHKIDKIDDKLWTNFYWSLAMMSAFAGVVFGVISHQFHWMT